MLANGKKKSRKREGGPRMAWWEFPVVDPWKKWREEERLILRIGRENNTLSAILLLIQQYRLDPRGRKSMELEELLRGAIKSKPPEAPWFMLMRNSPFKAPSLRVTSDTWPLPRTRPHQGNK